MEIKRNSLCVFLAFRVLFGWSEKWTGLCIYIEREGSSPVGAWRD